MRQLYKDSDRFRSLTLNMFVKARTPAAKFPKLKGKAVEIKTFGRPLLTVWTEKMTPGNPQHEAVKTLLTDSVALEDLLLDNKDVHKFPPTVANSCLVICERYLQVLTYLSQSYAAEGSMVFNVVPKAHFLWHTCWDSRHISPRHTYCYSGEDYMNHMKKMAGACLKGVQPHLISKKMCERWVYGMTFVMLDRSLWFSTGRGSRL